MSKIEQSPTIAFGDRVRAINKKNPDLMLFNIGESNQSTHPKIISAANEAMLAGYTKYSDSHGMHQLRQSIKEKLLQSNGFQNINEENILVTQGAVHGINITLGALLSPGDECIVIEPLWKTYASIILSKRAKPVYVADTNFENESIELELIIKAVNKKTKALILNTPNNPSGKVYSRSFLSEILSLSKKHNFYIISDEVYERFVYEKGVAHCSIGSLDKDLSNVISVYSFSKTYSMTGWRIGYLVANKNLMNRLLILSQISITNVAPFIQLAASKALTDPDIEASLILFIEEMSARFYELSEAVNTMNLQEFFKIPNAGFYCLLDISKFGDSLSISNYLLDNLNLALTPVFHLVIQWIHF